MNKRNLSIIILCTSIICLTINSGCNFIVKENENDYVVSDLTVSSELEATPETATSVVSSQIGTDILKDTETPHSDTSTAESKTNYEKETNSDKTENTESKKTSSKTQHTNSEQNTSKTLSLNVSDVTLLPDETKGIVAVNLNGGNVSFTSSDDKIASVNENGIITAHSEGKCTVTAFLENSPSIKANVSVTVLRAVVTESQVMSNTSTENNESRGNSSEELKPQVSDVSLSDTEKTLQVGQTFMPIVTMSPSNADTKSEIWTSSNEKVAIVDKNGTITAISEGECTVTVISVSNTSLSAEIHITVLPSQNEELLEFPTESNEEFYVDGILIVNKTYSLPSDYNPGGLTAECSSQFELLRQGARNDGINIYLSSGFRSYEYQRQLYNGYVSYYGQSIADTFSARPGHSEHQTGMAIDCNIVNDSFIGTPEAIWLEEHCYEYGFIIRYPQGKESITGYKYEPWHIRYIGVEKSAEIYNSGLTLEEYYGLPSEYNY